MREGAIGELFQFHTGSIKRTRGLPQLWGLSMFQFHTGSIKSQRRDHREGYIRHVSIPYWFD